MRKIGFITSGGDSPGMNAAIRSIVKTCLYNGIEPIGFYGGYQGIVEASFREFHYRDVNNIVQQGGTILGSSRSDEFRTVAGRKMAFDNIQRLGVEGLIVIGGDGSLQGALIFSDEFDFPIIGIPGTIDNDLFGSDYSIGFDTAINTVVENVDKIRDTANSHHRMFFVEVMGRNSGFIALHAAIASGAEMVLIPEEEVDLRELANKLEHWNNGERGSIFIVAEGEQFGGAEALEKRLKPYLKNEYEIRTTILGHIQRGGRPSAFDRILATRLGMRAVELLLRGQRNIMVGFAQNSVSTVRLEDAINKTNKISKIDFQILERLITM